MSLCFFTNDVGIGFKVEKLLPPGHSKPIEELIHDLSSIKTDVARKRYFDYVGGMTLNDIVTITSIPIFKQYIKMLKLFQDGEIKLCVILDVEYKIRMCKSTGHIILFSHNQLKKIIKLFVGVDENVRSCFRILKENIKYEGDVFLLRRINSLDIYIKTTEEFMKYIIENNPPGFTFNLSTLHYIISYLCNSPPYRSYFLRRVFHILNMKFITDIPLQTFLNLNGIGSNERVYIIDENLISNEERGENEIEIVRCPMSSTGRVMVTPQPIEPITASKNIIKIGNLIESISLCTPSSEVSFSSDYKEAFSNSLKFIFNNSSSSPSTIRRIWFSDDVSLTTTSQEGMRLIEDKNSQLKLVCNRGAFVFGGTLMEAAEPEEPAKLTKSAGPTRTQNDDDTTCSICLERKRNILFRPCSHFCSCSQCSVHLRVCPICRNPIRRKITVFVS